MVVLRMFKEIKGMNNKRKIASIAQSLKKGSLSNKAVSIFLAATLLVFQVPMTSFAEAAAESADAAAESADAAKAPASTLNTGVNGGAANDSNNASSDNAESNTGDSDEGTGNSDDSEHPGAQGNNEGVSDGSGGIVEGNETDGSGAADKTDGIGSDGTTKSDKKDQQSENADEESNDKTTSKKVKSASRDAMPTSDATLPSYSAEYVLNNANILSFGDAEIGNHTMSAVLVKGDFTANVNFDDAAKPSYIGGRFINGDNAYVDKRHNGFAELYLGASNTVSEDGLTVNGKRTFDMSTDGAAYINPGYIDWDRLKASIDSTASALANQCTGETIQVDGDWITYKIKAGSHVKIAINGYQGTKIELDGGDSLGDTIVSVQDSGSVVLPPVTNSTLEGEIGPGSGLVYVAPNASEVKLPNYQRTAGHIITPNARIIIEAGDFNGCMVGNYVNAKSAEGHIYPYSGANEDVSTDVEIEVSKSWNDSNNASNDRPNSVTVRLLANGDDTGKSVTLNENNGWKASFGYLAKKDDHGLEISYTVVEDAVAGYKAEVSGSAAKGFVVTNTRTDEKIETTSVSGAKTWNDGDDQYGLRPKSIHVKVMNGETVAAEKDVYAGEDGKWSYSFEGLPKSAGGHEISYTVVEDVPVGYEASYSAFDIVNTLVGNGVDFAKVDLNNVALAGATLSVRNADGQTVATWKTDAATKRISLIPGSYTLVEDEAPAGYALSKPIEFSVDENGVVTVGDVEVTSVVMVDAYSEAFLDVDFTKYLFANDTEQTYNFTMVECDVQGNVGEVSAATPYVRDGLVGATVAADDPFTVTVGNGEFVDYEASIDFPTMRYTKPGTHFYRVSENGVSNGDIVMDDSWYLLCVNVKPNQDTGALEAELTSRTQYYYGDSYEVSDDELAFCNNELMMLSCFGMDYGFAPAEDQKMMVAPAVKKTLEGRSLIDGEFEFSLVETTPGSSYSNVAYNDELGNVGFSPIEYTAPGTHTYEIREIAGNDGTVSYDSKVVSLTVDVTYDEYGSLRGAPVYSVDGAIVDEPTFVNTANKPIVRVQKTSKDGSGDPLYMAYYGLWMQNPNGADVYLGSHASDEDGYITFDDVDIQLGETYYFKEESAPAGHTVDEYRSDLFKVVRNGNSYEIVYEGEDAFDDGVASATASGKMARAKARSFAPLSEDKQIRTTGKADGGNVVLTYENDGVGVQDEVVKFEVSKFDKATHEYVEDAKFQILSEATGEVMASWTTGNEPEALERILNVNTRYILREVEAPEGYAKAADTIFVIGEYGDLTIVDGADAEATGKYSMNVYDTRLVAVNEVTEVTVEKRQVTDNQNNGKRVPQTGDGVPIALLSGICAASFATLALVRRKKNVR